MGNSAVIENYLNRLLKKYQQWWKFYWLIDQEYEQFDFGVEVQTEEAIQESIPTQRGSKKRTISFSVLDGIDLYARKEPVLLVGQPGSGKSTALMRFLLKAVEQAFQDPQAPIPVFIELRRCTIQSGGITTLIQETLERLGLEGADIKKLQFGNRPFLLLLDGLNELPSRQALTELNNFRENCADLGIPIVVTTRVLEADGLGIERKLEIKPLSPPEIQRFFQACLPFESKKRLQDLSDRLRELGRTPLMLWMLYVVLKEPQGEIPNSRGELFRRFIQIYERKREEKIYLDEDSKLDGETRRWWTRLLKPLAYEMMRSGKSGEPTDFRLDISKQDAETICKDFLKAEEVNNYPDLAIRCLDALIKHHLIQLDPEKQEIEFCHQLLQEYYAAEWLLDRLPELSDEQLKYYFLNYLKWTEAIGLMIGFAEVVESQVLQILKLALNIDFVLGARLAGAVHKQYAIEALADSFEQRKIHQRFRIFLLGKTGSALAITGLNKFFKNNDAELRWFAVEALKEIQDEKVISCLGFALNLGIALEDPLLCRSAFDGLKVISDARILAYLPKSLESSDYVIRIQAIQLIAEIGKEQAIPCLIKILANNDEDFFIRHSAVHALSEMLQVNRVSALVDVLLSKGYTVDPSDYSINFGFEDQIWIGDKLTFATGWATSSGSIELEFLKSISDKTSFTDLKEKLNHPDPFIRRNSILALGEQYSDYAVNDIQAALSDVDSSVRRNAIYCLKEIANSTRNAIVKRKAYNGLLYALDSNDFDIRASAASALKQAKEDVFDLLPTLSKQVLSAGKSIFEIVEVILAIQNRYQVYNYTIATQSDPPPPVQPFIFQNPANVTMNFYKDVYGAAGTVQGNQIINPPTQNSPGDLPT